MARVILHIGTHKTGTTTIQHVFASNRALLRQAGVIYPEVGDNPGHHGLIAPWVKLPEAFHVGDDPDRLWLDLAERHAAGAGTLFLSSEEFSRANAGHRVDFGHVRRLLAGFDSVHVVCLIRDQPSFLQSVFLEVSKGRRQPPHWPDFFKRALDSDLATGLHLDYNNLYDQLRADFAADELTFVSYNDACGHADGLIGDMLARIGAPLSASQLSGNVPINISPDPLAGWMAAAISDNDSLPQPAIAAAAAALRTAHGKAKAIRTTLYTRDELETVLDKYREPNAAFERRVREQDPAFRFPKCRIGAGHFTRDRLDEATWLAFARELYYRPAKPSRTGPH